MLFKVVFLVALSLAMFWGGANSELQEIDDEEQRKIQEINDEEQSNVNSLSVDKVWEDSSKGIKHVQSQLQDFQENPRSSGRNILRHVHCTELQKHGFCKYSLIRKRFCPRTCSPCYDSLGEPCCKILYQKKECGRPLTMKYCYKTCHNCFLCHKYAPLGMQNRKIPDKKITASSMWNSKHAPPQGRLHYKNPTSSHSGSWSSKHNRVGQWIQVDLSRVTKVTAVATQGRYGYSQWVTSYTLQHSLDGTNFARVEKGKVFSGNKDTSTVVKHTFSTPVIARYIRLIAKSWHNHISLRMELYGCR